MAETSKAFLRRLQDGFFEKYIDGKYGIDIGVGRIDSVHGADPIKIENCIAHDRDDCDAHEMSIFNDNEFEFVHASHVLEHMQDPILAIKNWFRITKPNGHLIIAVPDRDAYERKKTLPSRWNADHKFFLTAYKSEPPNTYSLHWLIQEALCGESFQIEYLITVNTCTNNDKPEEHGNGEYCIETVIKKAPKGFLNNH